MKGGEKVRQTAVDLLFPRNSDKLTAVRGAAQHTRILHRLPSYVSFIHGQSVALI